LRVIITADLDYPRLIALHQADRPGVILFRGGAYSDAEMLALLDRVLAQVSALDLGHSIVVVDRTRIRRRALPIASYIRSRRPATSGETTEHGESGSLADAWREEP